jgi:attachment p12 family protein
MDLQEIAALAIVAVAAGWLLVRLWRQARGKSAGGSCPGCNECGRPSSAPKATPLVTLQTRPPRRKPPVS